MLQFFSDYYVWIVLLVLLVNMQQRKIPNSDKKRTALLWILGLLLLYYFTIALTILTTEPWTSVLTWGGLALTIILAVILRKKIWPFRLHCKKCEKRLDLNHIIGHDDNLCQDCWDEAHPEEAEARKARERQIEEAKRPQEERLADEWKKATDVKQIDWDLWEPNHRCVITYVRKGGQLLFIEKKRGMGDGYYNAPGGHIELEETADEAAVRETREETGVEIENLEFRGTLRFQFHGGEDIREIGYVYFAHYASGELRECDEARPFWVDSDKIPYEKMWEDDRLWLPGALDGKKFEANFIFAGREMISSEVNFLEEDA